MATLVLDTHYHPSTRRGRDKFPRNRLMKSDTGANNRERRARWIQRRGRAVARPQLPGPFSRHRVVTQTSKRIVNNHQIDEMEFRNAFPAMKRLFATKRVDSHPAVAAIATTFHIALVSIPRRSTLLILHPLPRDAPRRYLGRLFLFLSPSLLPKQSPIRLAPNRKPLQTPLSADVTASHLPPNQ